jgi:hypothetical protein
MTGDVAAVRAELMATGNRLLAAGQAHFEADRPDAAWRLWREVDEINARYRALLPEVTVARCPHTGEPVRWPIDIWGLDGWYWSYVRKISRQPKSVPGSWLAMTGAMRLVEPVEHNPDVVVPGPGVPFVLPRLLGLPGVRAVVAEVPVGPHTGWAISYFGPMPSGVPLVDLWGTNNYPVFPHRWSAYRLRTAELDFDLTQWLRTGALQWLDGDTLRTGACPFADLPGERRIAMVWNGKVTYRDDAPVL